MFQKQSTPEQSRCGNYAQQHMQQTHNKQEIEELQKLVHYFHKTQGTLERPKQICICIYTKHPLDICLHKKVQVDLPLGVHVFAETGDLRHVGVS